MFKANSSTLKPTTFIAQLRQSSSTTSPSIPKKIAPSHHSLAAKPLPTPLFKVLQANSSDAIREQMQRAVANTQSRFSGSASRQTVKRKPVFVAPKSQPRTKTGDGGAAGQGISTALLRKRKEKGLSSFDSDAATIASFEFANSAPSSRPTDSDPSSLSARSRRPPSSASPRSREPRNNGSSTVPRPKRRPRPERRSPSSSPSIASSLPSKPLDFPSSVSYPPVSLLSLITPSKHSPSSTDASLEDRLSARRESLGDYSAYLTDKSDGRGDEVLEAVRHLLERNPSFGLQERKKFVGVVGDVLGK